MTAFYKVTAPYIPSILFGVLLGYKIVNKARNMVIGGPHDTIIHHATLESSLMAVAYNENKLTKLKINVDG